MKIVPLYRYENIFLVGLEIDFPKEQNLDGLVSKVDLGRKTIEFPAWSIQKMLKFGYYFPIGISERKSICEFIMSELGEEMIGQIVEKLIFPSQDAIDSLIWVPERLQNIQD